jgi:hypothetical protein
MKLKSDKYKKARGGDSKLLEISCSECESFVCNYQKDGSGNLRRMYVDRIFDSKVLISNKSLKCENGHLLGVAIIYKKENRSAFRLIPDMIKKKIKKSL